MIIICPNTFHILAFYNDWWLLIYSFKRSWSQSITIQMHVKLATHSRHSRTPRCPNFSTKLFWDVIHTYISNIHTFGDNRFTGWSFSFRLIYMQIAHIITQTIKLHWMCTFLVKKYVINTCSYTNIHMNIIFMVSGTLIWWYDDVIIENGQKWAKTAILALKHPKVPCWSKIFPNFLLKSQSKTA